MARRIPKPKLLRALVKRAMVPSDKATVRLIEDQLKDVRKYRELNDYFNQNQGRRWLNRTKIFMDWIWKHRDAILSILGLVLTFAADGSTTLRKIEDVEAEKERPEDEDVDETPDGEEVEDFVEEEVDELGADEADDLNPYDIGINEVRPEKESGKATD